MKRLLTAALVLGTIACTVEEGKSHRGGSSPLPRTTTSLSAATGGTALSPDRLFAVEVGPGMLAEDAVFTIVEGVANPAASVSLGKAYEVQVAPESAMGVGFQASVLFQVSAAVLNDVGASGLAIAWGSEVGTADDTVLMGTYDAVDTAYVVSTNHFSWFSLVEVDAYLACSCNTSAACNTGCDFCDPDCAANCPCDTSAACEYTCACDMDCTGGCTCDTSAACEYSCACDMDCTGGCACDTSAACDLGCESCDPDCGSTVTPGSGGSYPYPGCTSNTDCPTGDFCSDSICFSPCNTSTDCTAGLDCLQNGCVKSCTGDGAGVCASADCCFSSVICAPAIYCSGGGGGGDDCTLYLGVNDGCDCGCEATDPDCGGTGCTAAGCSATGCEYCWNGPTTPGTCTAP